jgi:hypothetical protein
MKKPVVALLVTLVGVTFLPVSAWSQNPPAPQNTPSKDIELNSVLMECTFKLEGQNAQGQVTMGTGFVMGRPILNTPDRARYVLITGFELRSQYLSVQTVNRSGQSIPTPMWL